MENSLVIDEKEEFIKNVQKWNYIETQLKEVNEKTKKMRTLKNTIGEKYVNIWKKILLLKTKLNRKKRNTNVYQKRIYTSLLLMLKTKLKEIIQDENQVDFVVSYLKENEKSQQVMICEN